MDQRIKPFLPALFLALLVPCTLAAEPGARDVEALAPELREALIAEMQAVQAGMMSVIPALAAGRWEEVAEIGASIRDSYIMEQALTPAQLDELHHALPLDFQALDAQFHEYAGMLSHAASARKPELVAFYHARMMESCVACHSRHAGSKFPELVAEPPRHHGH